MKKSLCWRCKNAVKRCPWSKNFTPVPGWIAEETQISSQVSVEGVLKNSSIPSYHVKECPMFKPDKVQEKHLNNEALSKKYGVSVRTIQRWKAKVKKVRGVIYGKSKMEE